MFEITFTNEEAALVLQHRRAKLASELAEMDGQLALLGTKKVMPSVKKVQEVEAQPKPEVAVKAEAKPAAKKTATKVQMAQAKAKSETNGHAAPVKKTEAAGEPSSDSLNGKILETLRASKGPLDVNDICRGALERGWASNASKPIAMVRISLGTLKSKGLVNNVARGMYQAHAH